MMLGFRFKDLKIKYKLLISNSIPILLLLLIFLFLSVNVNKIRVTSSQLKDTIVPKVETILLMKDISTSMILDLERYIATADKHSQDSFYEKKKLLDTAIETYRAIISEKKEHSFLFSFINYRDTLLEVGEELFSYYERREELTDELEEEEIELEEFFEERVSLIPGNAFFELYAYFRDLHAEILEMQVREGGEPGDEKLKPIEEINIITQQITEALVTFKISPQERTFFKEHSEVIFAIASELAAIETKIMASIDTLEYIENSLLEVTEESMDFQKSNAFEKISSSVSIIKRTLIEVILTIVLLIPVFLLISGYISRQISSSLSTLQESTRKIASGDLSQTISRDSNDEIGELYTDFNTMATELELSRKNLIQNILSSIPEYVIVFENESNIIKYANDLFINSFPFLAPGIRQETLIGKNFFDVIIIKPQLRKRLQRIINHNIILEKPKTVEIQVENRVFSNTMFTITSTESRKLAGVVISDITDAKFYQQHLVDNEKLIALGKVASGIAHEINNPLHAVLAYAESIEESTRIDDESKDFAQRIVDKVMLISSIIKDVSSYSKSLKRNEIIDVDLNDILEESLNIVKYSFNFMEIDVQTFFSPLPKIKAIKSEIHQVFINLLNNAVQAISGEGVLKLSSSHENNTIQISISDTGSGIEREDGKRIFDLFYTTKNKSNNTGQGLHIVKKILNKYKAAIDFQSEPGIGTTFYLTFTLAGNEQE